jgi:hypothetical protein
MNNTSLKRVLAAALAGAMAMSVASCMLFGPNKKEIVEAADTFATALLKKDPDKILKLTNEKNLGAFPDLFEEDNYSEEELKFFDAVGDTISYEIDEDSVEVSKDEASIDVLFSMVDYEEALKDGGYADIDEILDAIEDCDDIEEFTVTFEFEKDDDEWLITNFHDKGFGMLFFYYTYELDLTPAIADLIDYTDCWSNASSIFSDIYFLEDVSEYESNLSFDVYYEGNLYAADQPVTMNGTYIYCDYTDPDYFDLMYGEYEIVLKFDGVEVTTLSTTVEEAAVTEPTVTGTSSDGIELTPFDTATGELADYVVAVDWWGDNSDYTYTDTYGIEYDVYFTSDLTWEQAQGITYDVYLVGEDTETLLVSGAQVMDNRTNADSGIPDDNGYIYIYFGYPTDEIWSSASYLEEGIYCIQIFNPDGTVLMTDYCFVD